MANTTPIIIPSSDSGQSSPRVRWNPSLSKAVRIDTTAVQITDHPSGAGVCQGLGIFQPALIWVFLSKCPGSGWIGWHRRGVRQARDRVPIEFCCVMEAEIDRHRTYWPWVSLGESRPPASLLLDDQEREEEKKEKGTQRHPAQNVRSRRQSRSQTDRHTLIEDSEKANLVLA